MDKEKIRDRVENPASIEGIHNYCDRWCERCPFTSRCAAFAMEKEFFPDPQDREIGNERFWRKLNDLFRTTFELLQKEARSRGIDLNAVEPAAEESARKRRGGPAEEHELVRLAQAYSRRVGQWFGAAEGLFEEKNRELELVDRLDLPGRNPREEEAGVREAVEVVRWYQHLIGAKLHRAFYSRAAEAGLEDAGPDGLPKHSDGSAKVALLSMDRSIAVWGALRGHFPERGDEILDVLINLDRLRRRAEKEFPLARAFVRPGFDEGN